MTSKPPTPSLSFNDCDLTPNGIGVMTEHLRALPFLQTIPEPRVRAAVIALIAFGGTSDGQHRVRPGHPHPAPYDAHAANVATNRPHALRDEYMRLIMDLLTWYDRVSGGASFLVSTSATRPSGTPPAITAVKMDVFLPTVLQEQPKTSIVFARMVQCFAEEIGLLTMQRKDKAKASLRQRVHVVAADAAPPVDIQPLIPPSETPWHRFYGRDSGVLERLIAEQIASVGAVPEIPSVPPRPLLPLPASKDFGPRTTVLNLGLRKEAPWTARDIERFAEQFERCGEHDKAGRRAVMEQVSTRLPDVFSVVTDLERRVEDLETVNQTQLAEIESLQQALQESFDQRHVELMRIKAELSAPFVPELSRPSLAFGKEDESRLRSARSGRFAAPTTSNSMIPSASLISDSAPRSMYNARYEERKAIPVHAAPAPPSASTPNHSTRHFESRSDNISPNTLQAAGQNQSKQKIYGPNTDHVLRRHELSRRIHAFLRDVEARCPQEGWMQAVHAMVPNCSQDLARELVEAMKADCDLSDSLDPATAESS